jgi:hypothetical protein
VTSLSCSGWNKKGGLTVLHNGLKLFHGYERANQGNKQLGRFDCNRVDDDRVFHHPRCHDPSPDNMMQPARFKPLDSAGEIGWGMLFFCCGLSGCLTLVLPGASQLKLATSWLLILCGIFGQFVVPPGSGNILPGHIPATASAAMTQNSQGWGF